MLLVEDSSSPILILYYNNNMVKKSSFGPGSFVRRFHCTVRHLQVILYQYTVHVLEEAQGPRMICEISITLVICEVINQMLPPTFVCILLVPHSHIIYVQRFPLEGSNICTCLSLLCQFCVDTYNVCNGR